MSTYLDKLRDPRWQALSARVINRAGGFCQVCGSKRATEAHHKIYRRGNEPWEYSEDDLLAVCRCCHEGLGLSKSNLDEHISALGGAYYLSFIAGVAAGLLIQNTGDTVVIDDPFEIDGLALVFGVDPDLLQRFMGEPIGGADMRSLVALQVRP